MPLTAEEEAHDRADWLVDAVAGSTQERAFLRGDPEEDKVWTESIYLNGKKAILVALQRQLSHRDAEIDRLRADLATAHDRGREADISVADAEKLRTALSQLGISTRGASLEELGLDWIVYAKQVVSAVCRQAATAPPPAGADAGWRPTHRHHKGGLYRVIARGFWEPTTEGVVVYEAADRSIWVTVGDLRRARATAPVARAPQGGSGEP